MMNATIQTMATAGGPVRITNNISALVLAVQRLNGLLKRRDRPVTISVETAFTVNNIARTRVIPSSSYIDELVKAAEFSFLFLHESI